MYNISHRQFFTLLITLLLYRNPGSQRLKLLHKGDKLEHGANLNKCYTLWRPLYHFGHCGIYIHFVKINHSLLNVLRSHNWLRLFKGQIYLVVLTFSSANKFDFVCLLISLYFWIVSLLLFWYRFYPNVYISYWLR